MYPFYVRRIEVGLLSREFSLYDSDSSQRGMNRDLVSLVVAASIAQTGCNQDKPLVVSFPQRMQLDSGAWDNVPRWSVAIGPEICSPSSQASGCKILEEPQEVFADTDLFVFDKRQGLLELSRLGVYKRTWGDLGDYNAGYRQVKEIGHTPDAGLLIWDPVFFEVTRYDSTGRVVGRSSLRTGNKPEWKSEPVQGLHLTASSFVFLSVPTGKNVLSPVRAHFWLARAPDFVPLHVLDVEALSDRQEGDDLQPPIPFVRPTQQWALTRDGTIWYLVPDTVLRLRRYAVDGKALSETVIAIHPPRTNPSAMLKLRDQRITRTLHRADLVALGNGCKPPEGVQCLTYQFFDSAAKLSTHYPIIDVMIPQTDNTVWMQSAHIRGDSVRWTHLSRAGAPDGMIILPVEMIIARADSEQLALRRREPRNGDLGIKLAALNRH